MRKGFLKMKLTEKPKVQGRGRKVNPKADALAVQAAEILASEDARKLDDPSVALRASDLRPFKGAKDSGYATLRNAAKRHGINVSRVSGQIAFVPASEDSENDSDES
jgi:hypothetical protein